MRFIPWPTLLVLLSTQAAFAQQKASSPESEARAHYETGMTLYDAGDFAKAIEEFRTAYELVPTPGLLFNLGQAYRLEKNYDMALYFYRTYLSRMAEAPNRMDVERRIAEMEELLKTQPPRTPTPPEKPAVAPAQSVASTRGSAPAIAVPPAAPPVDDRGADGPGRTRRLTGIVLAGVGAALVVTGVAFGAAASSTSSDVEQQARERGMWDSQLAARYKDGQSEALRSNVFMIAGGAAVVTGGIFYYLGWRDTRQLSLAPTRGGAEVTLSCVF